MKQKDWTIMVYMAGDNNLAVDMAYAMEQIREIAGEGNDSLNLFVYYDGNSPEIPTLYCDFTDATNPAYYRSYKLHDDKLYKNVPKKRNENAANKYSVINFVDWCVNKVKVENNGQVSKGRRAKRYALIFSGHSLGFQDIGLFKDEGSDKAMKMDDLFKVLKRLTMDKEFLEQQAAKKLNKHSENGSKALASDLLDQTDLLLGQPIDILGFDSCVMGMLEVGYQFAHIAKTMVVSEGSVPSAGWTYAKVLGGLARGQHRNSPVEKVAEHFVTEFIKSQENFTVGAVSVDMAAWDMSQFKPLADAFNNLSSALIECLNDKGSRIYRQMERVILHVHWKCQSYMFEQNVDLGDFCELLDEECRLVADEIRGETEVLTKVRNECRNVLDALRKAVILSGFSGGKYQYSNGISIFFPWSSEGYYVSKENYDSLFFAKDAKHISKNSGTKRRFWGDFLKKYLNEVARRESVTPTVNVLPGKKYSSISGIKFSDELDSQTIGAFETLLTKSAGSPVQKSAGSPVQKGAGSPVQKGAGSPVQKSAGSQVSKLGGGGSNAFFDNLVLFKNVESKYNVSGYTRKPDDPEPESGKTDIGLAGSA